MQKQRQDLAKRLRSLEFTSLPGVFEMISAKIASDIGFPGLYMGGYGAVASYLGLPDAGLATYTDMIDRVSRIVNVTGSAVIADGDTGYGGLLNVEHTVRGYERAGAAGIQIEDQVFPKKCGHTPGRRVVPLEDMVAKINVARDARTHDDFLIIARTDARGMYGLDEALRRGDAFVEAGADVIFIESPETDEEMRTICTRFAGNPLIANMVDGGSTPVLSAADLKDIGYTIAIFPCTAFLAMAAAVRDVYQHIKEHGSTPGLENDLYDFTDFSKLMGFEDIWAFEKKWAGAEGGG